MRPAPHRLPCASQTACHSALTARSGSRHHATAAAAASAAAPTPTPLLSAVLQRGSREHEVPLHVPGHKRGRAVDPGMQQLLTGHEPQASATSALRYDLTELAGLDYLSLPTSVIREAQQLAAAAFGADHTWFLVNGCSAGIHAAVMAAVRPGQALLLARNCHLSAFAACVLADCVPVWLQPEQDAVHGVAHCVTPEQLQAGFAAARQRGMAVAAALVVSPTYYGAVARIRELADVCHAEGVALLVDEAHGGHLGFMQADTTTAAAAAAVAAAAGQGSSPAMAGALAAGADVVMQSSHKVLTAMTQAAMLHVRGTRVEPGRISKALQVLQTSSPSYLLLASLDAARQHATTPGVWSVPLAAAAAARSQLQQLPGLALLQQGSCGSEDSVTGFDPLRLVLNVGGRGWSGFGAAGWLEQQHGIVSELATSQLVVFVFGPGSSMQDAAALVEACRQLPTQQDDAAAGAAAASSIPRLSQPAPAAVLTPRQAFNAASEAVPLHAVAGRVSAELLCPYPPGVPVVFPGERFSAGTVAALQQTLAAGGVVTGGQDSELSTVLVVVER